MLTGGGAHLRHVAQLTEFMTGLDTRIGYPNEHLASDVIVDMASPMYATGVGLIIYGSQHISKETLRRGEGSSFGNWFRKIKKWFIEFF